MIVGGSMQGIRLTVTGQLMESICTLLNTTMLSVSLCRRVITRRLLLSMRFLPEDQVKMVTVKLEPLYYAGP